MMQQKPQPKPQQKSHDSINQEPVWLDVRRRWAAEKMDRAKSYARAYLDADDEELPLARHLLLFAIFGFFVLFVLWANFATLDEVTRGNGKVIPSSEVQALQSLEPGIVEEFMVKEGDEVKAGQILLRLSDVDASSDLGANQARYYSLLASISRLQAEAEDKNTVEFSEEVMKNAPRYVTEELNAFRANKQQLQGQMNVLSQQLTQRQQEIRELESRVDDLREVLRMQAQERDLIKPLVERGSAPELELLQVERALKEKDSELNSALSALPRSRSAAQEARARMEELQSGARADAQTALLAKQSEMNEITERLSALTARKSRTEIKSPVNGTIQEVLVNTIGGIVRPGEDIIKIVPKDDQLLVEARVRPSDIAFLYPTQKAIVKISAYDFSIYGGLKGEVIDISADTIEDEKGDSFYRVRLRTYESELKRKGEILPIIPGMVASVDILTGKKTVMQYLLKPFIKTLDSAMSER